MWFTSSLLANLRLKLDLAQRYCRFFMRSSALIVLTSQTLAVAVRCAMTTKT